MNYRFLRFPGGKTKAFTMSYDDGCREDLKLAQIISQYGMKCTFNHTSIAHLSTEEVKEHFLDRGHEIAVHGMYHKAEGLIRPIEGIRDVLDCRLLLEEKFGTIIRGMAYPDSGIITYLGGSSYEQIRRYLSDLDIAYARTLGGDNDAFLLPSDWYAWMPTAHHKNPELMAYLDKFLSITPDKDYEAGAYPRLFYLWGHSFEFEQEGNWDLLEAICRRASGNEFVWYATNMEIYSYVKAYESLVYSADGKTVYNPTLQKIWFVLSGALFSIEPGKTLHI